MKIQTTIFRERKKPIPRIYGTSINVTIVMVFFIYVEERKAKHKENNASIYDIVFLSKHFLLPR